ncbi:MAG: NAD(+) diphosphatase [Alphaproteobacteria bacterium]
MWKINVFAGSPLDRAGHRRADPAWLAARLTDPASRFVPVWRARNLVTVGDPAAAVRLDGAAAAVLIADGASAVFLGLDGGAAHFALDLSHFEEDRVRALAGVAEPLDLWAIGGTLPRDEAALLAHARALVTWHQRHRFCGVCGAPTEPREAGHVRACTDPACAALHFPRTDPAVIMLVTFGERCLLGRQKSWADPIYSTLAGFVEPGESLEEAVAREVMEEVGVPLSEVVYHSSQPWPFPLSMMIGFTAVAATDHLVIDGVEIADARWLTRADIRNHAALGFRLPRPHSIARHLIEDWLRADR